MAINATQDDAGIGMHGLSISVFMTGQATEALVHGHLGRLCGRRRRVERIVPLHFLFFLRWVSRERNTEC